jgi:hypothetical protein
MLTFREFRDSEDEESKKKAIEVVRKGMNLGGDRDFWDDFLSLCGNVEGMSALLGAPREMVTSLGGRIGEMREEIGESSKETSKRDRMIKTGDKT